MKKLNYKASEKYAFLTGSSYEGSWREETHCMHTFGTYTYPDLSEYRGYFKNGKFHGYGRLRLATPHNFTVEGSFVNGVLTSINNMWFHDGLTINETETIDKKMLFKNWKYCSESDRRFVRELVYGLEPVQPNAIITAEKKARVLDKPTYDTVEGVFDENSGFVSDRAKPLKHWRFINCLSESDWIRKYCRRSDKLLKEPLPAEERDILENDLRVANDLERRSSRRLTKIDPFKRYLYKLCEKEREEGAECIISDQEIYCPMTSEISQCHSFSASSEKEDVNEICASTKIKYEPKLSEVTGDVLVRRNIYGNVRSMVRMMESNIKRNV